MFIVKMDLSVRDKLDEDVQLQQLGRQITTSPNADNLIREYCQRYNELKEQYQLEWVRDNIIKKVD